MSDATRNALTLAEKVKLGDWLRQQDADNQLEGRTAKSVAVRVNRELGLEVQPKSLLAYGRAFGVDWGGGQRGRSKVSTAVLQDQDIDLAWCVRRLYESLDIEVPLRLTQLCEGASHDGTQ